MPLIGSRTEVTLDNLSTLDGSMRLTAEKKGETTVLYASKGTLSDGLYSLRAIFCPTSVRKEAAANLKEVKEAISNQFGKDTSSAFSRTLSLTGTKSEGKTAPLKASRITIGLINTALDISKFKANTLPNISIKGYEKSSQESFEKSSEAKEKSFDTALKNFLDQNPNASEAKLSIFLKNYGNNEITSFSEPNHAIEPKRDNLKDIKKSLREDTNFVLDFSPLSKEISEIRRTFDPDKFFDLLGRLSDKKTIFQSTDGNKKLDESGKVFFIKHLLASFTLGEEIVTKDGERELEPINKEAFHFFAALGAFLAPDTSGIKRPKPDALLAKAELVLKEDDTRNQEIQESMKDLKTKVEDRINQGLTPQGTNKLTTAVILTPREIKQKNRSERIAQDNKISQAILSPHAREMINHAIILLKEKVQEASK